MKIEAPRIVPITIEVAWARRMERRRSAGMKAVTFESCGILSRERKTPGRGRAVCFLRSCDRLMALEVLDCALVGFGFRERGERPQVTALPCLRVLLAGIQAVLAGLEFANH